MLNVKHNLSSCFWLAGRCRSCFSNWAKFQQMFDEPKTWHRQNCCITFLWHIGAFYSVYLHGTSSQQESVLSECASLFTLVPRLKLPGDKEDKSQGVVINKCTLSQSHLWPHNSEKAVPVTVRPGNKSAANGGFCFISLMMTEINNKGNVGVFYKVILWQPVVICTLVNQSLWVTAPCWRRRRHIGSAAFRWLQSRWTEREAFHTAVHKAAVHNRYCQNHSFIYG